MSGGVYLDTSFEVGTYKLKLITYAFSPSTIRNSAKKLDEKQTRSPPTLFQEGEDSKNDQNSQNLSA